MPRTKTKRPAREKKTHAAPIPATVGKRLHPGALDGLVLDYMARHQDSGPFGPGAIAKGVEKSAGAVANSLVRLARNERVREVGERPLRYTLTA